MGLAKEFREFLREYKVGAIALAFIMGQAVNDLARSFVDNMVMPLVAPLVREGRLADAATVVGPINLTWGAFFSELVNFSIIAGVVFFVFKKVLRRKG